MMEQILVGVDMCEGSSVEGCLLSGWFCFCMPATYQSPGLRLASPDSSSIIRAADKEPACIPVSSHSLSKWIGCCDKQAYTSFSDPLRSVSMVESLPLLPD